MGTVSDSKRQRDKLYARFARHGETKVRIRLLTGRMKPDESELAERWLEGLEAHFEHSDRWTAEKQEALRDRLTLATATGAMQAAWGAVIIAVAALVVSTAGYFWPHAR